MILRGAEPFFLPGSREEGILLIHGFTGTPAEMVLLGEYLQDRGYTVLAVRLSGHGTSPEDLAKTAWQNWYDSVCDGYDLLRGVCSRVSVIGLSMGALMAMRLSLDRTVEKVVSLSAPIFISAGHNLRLLPPPELAEGRYVPKKRRKLPDLPERCNVYYHKMPLVSVYQLLAFIERMKEHLPQVSRPLLVVQSRNDHTVKAESGEYIYEQVSSAEKEILYLGQSGHLVTLDIERNTVFAKVAEFLAQEKKQEIK